MFLTTYLIIKILHCVIDLSIILCLQNKYKEKYANHMKGHYEGTGLDKKTLHAMKVRNLASDVRLHCCYCTANIVS